MKTKTLVILCIMLNTFFGNAQNDSNKSDEVEKIKDKLIELNNRYDETHSKYNGDVDISGLKTKLITLENSDEYHNELDKQLKNIEIAKELNLIIREAEMYKSMYIFKYKEDSDGVEINLDDLFKPREKIKFDIDNRKESSPKTYLYFGKDKVIAEDSIFNDKKINTVFQNFLAEKSETYLGDFIIPQNGQKININNYVKNEKDSLYFKKVKIHVLHGLIQDIKILVTDDHGNEHLFENKYPISLLKYSKLGPKNNMFYSYSLSNNKDIIIDDDYNNCLIKLADVLMYINSPGENFVPDELKLEFPTKTDGTIDNLVSSVSYELRQETTLENILNLRTYTDFLSLFGDAPNGIFQIEGKADFFVNPFNFPNKNWFFFKKISPYVNFARIDDELRNMRIENNTIVKDLEVLEKSYLNMGVDLDLFSFKFGKEFPFESTFYGRVQYNIADVMGKENTPINYKSLGLGGGFRVDIKRYNNFGFTIKAELTNINTNEFNSFTFIENPSDFIVFRNEAEIYYHPGENKSQSVFLRLNTYNNSSTENSEAFYQLQFGYRFSIGINTLKN